MARDDQRFDITPALLLQAYSSGIFPMADGADQTVHWIDPLMRGVLPLDRLHVSRSLRKLIRQERFQITVDTQFETVMHACADREETWINDELIEAYTGLHDRGYAHSIEVKTLEGQLVGGLYGVTIGSAYFGESMFSRVPSASKIALVYLVARLRAGGFTLLDTQFVTDHLVGLGAIEIPRGQYHARLVHALRRQSDWFALPVSAAPEDVLQLVTHTS